MYSSPHYVLTHPRITSALFAIDLTQITLARSVFLNVMMALKLKSAFKNRPWDIKIRQLGLRRAWHNTVTPAQRSAKAQLALKIPVFGRQQNQKFYFQADGRVA